MQRFDAVNGERKEWKTHIAISILEIEEDVSLLASIICVFPLSDDTYFFSFIYRWIPYIFYCNNNRVCKYISQKSKEM